MTDEDTQIVLYLWYHKINKTSWQQHNYLVHCNIHLEMKSTMGGAILLSMCIFTTSNKLWPSLTTFKKAKLNVVCPPGHTTANIPPKKTLKHLRQFVQLIGSCPSLYDLIETQRTGALGMFHTHAPDLDWSILFSYWK